MPNENGDIWIVFNGEIYNYKVLKSDLQKKGHVFKNNSDTEVIIHFYEEYGPEEFYKLNGIFAFAIFDKKNNHVILARDHIGVKPLYYYVDQNQLLFGSELKAIFQDRTVKKEIDHNALNNFLTFRYNPSPYTLFKNIYKLEPGHFLKVNSNGKFEKKSFWEYKPETINISFDDAISEYQRLLENAVKKQMMSDVPVGLFLSGGVDSAIIGYFMNKYSNSKIKAFTIGFEEGSKYNEIEDAITSSQIIGVEHISTTISQNQFNEFFPISFSYLEEPVCNSSTALFFLSKLVSKHLKVVLSGQGADELLAGYNRYRGLSYLIKYRLFYDILRKIKLDKIIISEKLKRILYVCSENNEIDMFLAIYTIFNPIQKELLVKEKYDKMNTDDKDLISNYYQSTINMNDSLSKLMYIDTRTSLSDSLLLYGDKMTMAASLEMRVPFLDIELVKFLESIPSKYKLKGTTHKYLHKKAVSQWLPATITGRKKKGFEIPFSEWFKDPKFMNMLESLLTNKDSACNEYFNVEYIKLMLKQHLNNQDTFFWEILTLYSFELWYNNFYRKL